MNLTPRKSSLRNAVLVEAVQLIEQTGPLEDAQVMREAAHLQGDDEARIEARALALGARIGLQQDIDHARTWAPWVGLGLVAVVVLASLGVAGSVMGEQRINVMAALVSLLGVHLVTLLFWSVGLALPNADFKLSLGRLWLTLTARVAGGRLGQMPVLLRATMRLLLRARLLPWALGFVSHAIWTLSFAVILASMLFALAFRNYVLSWETTILDPGFFVQSIRLLGWLPSLIGFPVPDAQTVLAAGTASTGQRAMALWLTGCLVTYGLLPRALLALGCAAVWRARQPAMREPDRSAPDYRKLVNRFEAMAPPDLVDADPGMRLQPLRSGLAPQDRSYVRMAIAFELPSASVWPPRELAPPAWTSLRIDGSGAQRRALLDQLSQQRPQLVLIACNAVSSPDRGTARFLRDVHALCGELRVWLVADGAVPDAAAARRWQAWLTEAGLAKIRNSASLATLLPGVG